MCWREGNSIGHRDEVIFWLDRWQAIGACAACPASGAAYNLIMSVVEQVEDAVRRLSADERMAFRSWFAEFDAQEWDNQLEADVAAGRLAWLVEEARQDKQAARCTKR